MPSDYLPPSLAHCHPRGPIYLSLRKYRVLLISPKTNPYQQRGAAHVRRWTGQGASGTTCRVGEKATVLVMPFIASTCTLCSCWGKARGCFPKLVPTLNCGTRPAIVQQVIRTMSLEVGKTLGVRFFAGLYCYIDITSSRREGRQEAWRSPL